MITILHGDCIEKMRELADERVHLIVTSPPYWGLRDYKIPPSIWGGDPNCQHQWEQHIQLAANGIIHEGGMTGETLSGNSATRKPKKSDFCTTCNAWRGTFGLEPTPELYIEHAVMIFREAKRVLRKDGTLWINLGDSYATAAGQGNIPGGGGQGQRFARNNGHWQPNRARQAGLKAGDLCGMPWRVAFALQADGWYLRRDNIWFKKNPMPESVSGWRWERHRVKVKGGWTKENHPSALGGSDKSRCGAFGTHNGTKPSTHAAEFVDCPGCDKCTPNGGLVLRKGNWRCTTSHEYVFQFSKSDSYFCDAEAARERTTGNAHGRGAGVNPKTEGRNSRMYRERTPAGATNKPNSSRSAVRGKQNASFSAAVTNLVNNRNRRSVWPIATAPYRDAHFATFPPALVQPIIRAASPTRCCAKCRAPYAPVVERSGGRDWHNDRMIEGVLPGEVIGDDGNKRGRSHEAFNNVQSRVVIAHRATCKCTCKLTVPAVVLDMFGGSGTVGQVAEEEGRDAILIEISEAYIPLIRKRCSVTAGLAL